MTFPVDTHTHTLASTHAYSSIHDYLAEAKRKGIKLFATTDHGPAMPDAPHFWHFVNLRVLPRMYDGVGILRGIEANICDLEGKIDYFGQYHAELDIILAGFHEPVLPPTHIDDHTQAMVNTIKSGMVDIITHPGNPAYPIHVEAVVDAAVAHNVALEVNNSSFACSRKGSEANCLNIIQSAKEKGASIVVASDSHVAFSLGEFPLAMALIEQAEFPPSRILNRSPEALLAFLAARGRETVHDFKTYFDFEMPAQS